MSVSETARKLEVSKQLVRRWRGRFIESRLDGLLDKSRSGRPHTYSEEQISELYKAACNDIDDEGHWSNTRLFATTGISTSHISRLLKLSVIKPWLVKEWKHSPDPEFRKKVRRICRLYRICPKNTVVFSVDEKTAVQALERVHPTRACGEKRATRRAFEYKRHGVTNLFAALNVHTGEVISMLADRKRSIEFIELLRKLDAAVESGKFIVLILDNSSIHDSAEVLAWLKKECPKRFKMVFTPTHASWVNQVEMFFSRLSRKLLRPNSFPTMKNLRTRLTTWISNHNKHNAKPYKWSFTGYKWANQGVG